MGRAKVAAYVIVMARASVKEMDRDSDQATMAMSEAEPRVSVAVAKEAGRLRSCAARRAVELPVRLCVEILQIR